MRNHAQMQGVRQALLLIGLVASVALAGCSSASGSTSATGTSTARSTATATNGPTAIPAPSTFTPTPQATVPPAVAQACGNNNLGGNGPVSFYLVGDLYISVAPGGQTYPARKLPDGTPVKPFKLDSTHLDQQLPLSPLVNPVLSSGYTVNICDASSTAHHIEGISVKIVSVTPYSGALSSWSLCDGWYSNGQPGGGSCGGGYVAGEYLKATFDPNAGAGTTIAAAFVQAGVDANEQPQAPLPLTLPPATELNANVALVPPTVTGYYQFAFSVKADGAYSTFVTDPNVVLLDPNAHVWSGQACTTSAMAAQIPSDGNEYICPS